jgi:hypothetical protein
MTVVQRSASHLTPNTLTTKGTSCAHKRTSSRRTILTYIQATGGVGKVSGEVPHALSVVCSGGQVCSENLCNYMVISVRVRCAYVITCMDDGPRNYNESLLRDVGHRSIDRS